MNYFNRDIFLEIFFAAIISCLIVLFSDTSVFLKIFNFYNIDHLVPSFADIRSYQALTLTVENGFDPYINHEYDPWKRPFNLPIIWLYISKYLNLVNEINFKLFVFFYIALFIFCTIKIIKISNNYLGSVCVIFCTLSAACVLAIERGNSDLIIFSLIFFASIQKKFFSSLLILISASILKLYPIFSFIINFDKKEKIFISFFSIIFVFCTLFTNLKFFFYNTHSTFNTGLTFGIRPIVLGFFKGIERLEINFIQYSSLSFNIIYLVILLCTFLLFIYFVYKNKKTENINFLNIENRLFLAGSSIYCFSFIFFSSFDYRLIFLILTLPYLTQNIDLNKKIIILFILISSNSLIFYSLANSPNDYIYIGLLNHFCKFLLFILFTNELSKFFKIFYKNIFFSKN